MKKGGKSIRHETEVEKGEIPPSVEVFTPYFAEVKTTILNCREGAGATTSILSQLHLGEVVKILEEKVAMDGDKWGNVSSGGWVALKFCQKKD